VIDVARRVGGRVRSVAITLAIVRSLAITRDHSCDRSITRDHSRSLAIAMLAITRDRHALDLITTLQRRCKSKMESEPTVFSLSRALSRSLSLSLSLSLSRCRRRRPRARFVLVLCSLLSFDSLARRFFSLACVVVTNSNETNENIVSK